jgi:hypothetical protein
VPYGLCLYQTPTQCDAGSLLDVPRVMRATDLGLTVDLLDGIASGRGAVEAGCAIITVAAFASLLRAVKLGTLGFIVLGLGLWLAKIVPLPPGVLLAFLCSYAGFSSAKQAGEEDAMLREQQQLLEGALRKREAGERGKEAGGKGSSPAKKAGSGRTSKHKRA